MVLFTGKFTDYFDIQVQMNWEAAIAANMECISEF